MCFKHPCLFCFSNVHVFSVFQTSTSLLLFKRPCLLCVSNVHVSSAFQTSMSPLCFKRQCLLCVWLWRHEYCWWTLAVVHASLSVVVMDPSWKPPSPSPGSVSITVLARCWDCRDLVLVVWSWRPACLDSPVSLRVPTFLSSFCSQILL